MRFVEAGDAGFYRLEGAPRGAGMASVELQLPGSCVLGRGGKAVQACEGVIMAAMACGMGVCSGQWRAEGRPAAGKRAGCRHCHPVAFSRRWPWPASVPMGLAGSWWFVWRACARTGQGEVRVDEGRAAMLLHRLRARPCT